ncbi:MAG: hypothetical protein H8E13_08985 [Actinobacteria bacterium]|nr:hypothetical protein [Actinomycetota bacterium]
MDFFIKNILSKELLEKFKKNPKKLIKFSLVYQENILGFKYVDDLKRFLFKEITE